ncbi:hypothetical protein [Sphingomonas sp. LY160]|uniref:hypothetical protein n=1 Tax=Sphingomonas sp. LY160 TaxID=3095342 RepID=UPI002ADEF03B|nr:hypothetical protein [Sphingomonas sp. LY160]MEA1072057.1 hypothetical protein [Sphingomonas sp. LY160]
MDRTANLVERAFQIAPDCNTLKELKTRLQNEGYLQVESYFDSKTLRKQVTLLLATEPTSDPD